MLGCKSTSYDKRLEMFEKGKYLEDWPWVNKPKEYLNDNRLKQVRTVLWYNCVLLKYTSDDSYFLSSARAANLRDEYKKESE